MYDIKIYEDGKERETIRGLFLAQASVLQSFLDRKGIKHTVKRLTSRATDGLSPDHNHVYIGGVCRACGDITPTARR